MEEKLHETQPTSPPAPDPDVPPTFPTKLDLLPSHRSKWLLLLIVGFLVIFFSIYTIQFLTERKQQKQTTTIAPPISAPSPAVDPTANWKTYTNEKYGFSIRIPQNWEVRGGDDIADVLSIDFEPAGSPVVISMTAELNKEKLTINEYINQFSFKNKPKASTKINQYTATLVKNIGSKKYAYDGYFLMDDAGKVLYEVDIPSEGDQDYETAFQILSTFKFTKQQSVQGAMTQKNIVTVWKTYSLGKYDHFQYPADWIAKEDKNGFINLTPISQSQQAANKRGKVEKQATVIITGEGSEFPRKPTQQTSVAFTTMTVAGLISAKATITYLTNSEYPKGTKHIQVMIPGAGYIFFLNDIKYSDIFFNMLSSLILDNGEPPPLQGNPLPFVNFKVGALISGMTVSSVGPVYPEFPINSLNASVRFSGKQRLIGEYYKAYATHDICLDGIGPAKAVPTIVGIKLNLLHLCFDNQDVAKKLFKSQKENDRVTVIVNNYVMNITPNQEIPTTATLLSIERKK